MNSTGEPDANSEPPGHRGAPQYFADGFAKKANDALAACLHKPLIFENHGGPEGGAQPRR